MYIKKTKQKEKHDLKISMVRHKSAKNVVLSFYTIKFPLIVTEKELLNQKINTYIDGKKRVAHVRDVIVEAKRNSVWGFCTAYAKQKGYKEIHFWVKGTPSKEKILEFLGHELSHAVGYKNELTACKMGNIAVFSSYLYDSIFVKKQLSGMLK